MGIAKKEYNVTIASIIYPDLEKSTIILPASLKNSIGIVVSCIFLPGRREEGILHAKYSCIIK
jgi:hypothetical protein